MDITKTRKKLDNLIQEYKYSVKLCENEEEKLQETRQKLNHIDQSRSIMQLVAEGVQATAHKQITNIVSKCLETIFEDPYEFLIKFEQKRGKTEANLIFIRDGNEIDPIYSSGGGVLDVASFALRLACLVLSKPKKRKILIMDEPYKMLSVEYLDRVAQLLKLMSEELDVQFIIVTHSKFLKIGKVIEIE